MAMHFPDKLMEKIALIEMCSGLGLMGGPIMGAAIYTIGGYMSVFISMCLLFFLLVPYMVRVIPVDKPYVSPKNNISYFQLFSIKVMDSEHFGLTSFASAIATNFSRGSVLLWLVSRSSSRRWLCNLMSYGISGDRRRWLLCDRNIELLLSYAGGEPAATSLGQAIHCVDWTCVNCRQ